jgi:hypothetical protein
LVPIHNQKEDKRLLSWNYVGSGSKGTFPLEEKNPEKGDEHD